MEGRLRGWPTYRIAGAPDSAAMPNKTHGRRRRPAVGRPAQTQEPPATAATISPKSSTAVVVCLPPICRIIHARSRPETSATRTAAARRRTLSCASNTRPARVLSYHRHVTHAGLVLMFAAPGVTVFAGRPSLNTLALPRGPGSGRSSSLQPGMLNAWRSPEDVAVGVTDPTPRALGRSARYGRWTAGPIVIVDELDFALLEFANHRLDVANLEVGGCDRPCSVRAEGEKLAATTVEPYRRRVLHRSSSPSVLSPKLLYARSGSVTGMVATTIGLFSIRRPHLLQKPGGCGRGVYSSWLPATAPVRATCGVTLQAYPARLRLIAAVVRQVTMCPVRARPLRSMAAPAAPRRGIPRRRPVLRCGCMGEHAHHLLGGRSNRVSRTYYNGASPTRLRPESHPTLRVRRRLKPPSKGQPAKHFRVSGSSSRDLEVRVVRDDGLLIAT